ncbi:MAG: hypothetical protein HZA90_01975 [Verrucomicrobia bacterium]|nr:hypothetical protein [Verrucomicrobiota bacterium]
MSALEVLQGYARRWNLECTFRDLKQFLGFEDSSATSEKAVTRTAPFVGLVFSLLVIWFVESASALAQVPLRPWYARKKNLSFEDILRTARFALTPFTDILVARCVSGKLGEIDNDRRTEEWAIEGRSMRPAA